MMERQSDVCGLHYLGGRWPDPCEADRRIEAAVEGGDLLELPQDNHLSVRAFSLLHPASSRTTGGITARSARGTTGGPSGQSGVGLSGAGASGVGPSGVFSQSVAAGTSGGLGQAITVSLSGTVRVSVNPAEVARTETEPSFLAGIPDIYFPDALPHDHNSSDD